MSKKEIAVNISEHTRDLFIENYKILMKENSEDLNKYREKLRKCFGRAYIIKRPVHLKSIYRLDIISIKIPARFFHKCSQNYSRIYIKRERY